MGTHAFFGRASYGVTGVLMLGVKFDYVLLVGALIVIAASRALKDSSAGDHTGTSKRTQTAA